MQDAKSYSTLRYVGSVDGNVRLRFDGISISQCPKPGRRMEYAGGAHFKKHRPSGIRDGIYGNDGQLIRTSAFGQDHHRSGLDIAGTRSLRAKKALAKRLTGDDEKGT